MPSKAADWYDYDQTDIERRRKILREFLDSDDAIDVADNIRSLLPSQHFGPSFGREYLGRHNTERAYRSDQRSYVAASAKAGIDPLNPSRDFWESYFEARATTPVHGKLPRLRSLHRHAYGIGNLFHQYGLPSPTRTPTHKRLMRRLGRYDDRKTRKARPLFGEAVHRLVASYSGSSPSDYRDRAIIAIGGTRGFRSHTIVGMSIEHIEFEQRGVVIGLRDEKTSVTRELVYTATPHSKHHRTCMPCILQRHVALLKTLGITEGPVFRKIDRWGYIGPTALTTKSITLILRRGLARVGIEDPESYSSHSFRHGVVKDGVQKGRELQEIMMTTMHRSMKGLRAYIEGIDPWYGSPQRSILDDTFSNADDPQGGWRHV